MRRDHVSWADSFTAHLRAHTSPPTDQRVFRAYWAGGAGQGLRALSTCAALHYSRGA
jgi:hypothetical protein